MRTNLISIVLRLILGKLIWFLPVLFVISVVAFSIVNSAAAGATLEMSDFDYKNDWTSIRFMAARDRHDRGEDLPLFYIGIHPLSLPDTLCRVADDDERAALRHLGMTYGNWKQTDQYHRLVLMLDAYHHSILEEISPETSPEIVEQITRLCVESHILLTSWQDDIILSTFSKIYQICAIQPYANQGQKLLDKTMRAYAALKTKATPLKTWIPVLSFHFPNRYHYWLFGSRETGHLSSMGILRGDMGISTVDGTPVANRVLPKVGISVLISLLGIVLAYIFSIPLGFLAATQRGRFISYFVQTLMFLLYVMPPFVLAVVLIYLFANPGMWGGSAPLPSGGLFPVGGFSPDAGIMQKCVYIMPHLLLPVICYSIALLAILGKMLDNSLTTVLASTYIRTARAKGLGNRAVLGKHALKPGIYPLLTLAGDIFPLVISGSVIIESIFNIPGMGSEIMRAYYRHDHNTLAAIMLMSAALTMTGFLFSDLMYILADPRTRQELR